MNTTVFSQWLLLTFMFCTAVYVGVHGQLHLPLALYTGCWCIFHAVEYICTVVYTGNTSDHLFLIFGAKGSTHLLCMTMLSIFEHTIWKILTNRAYACHWFGVPLVLLGISIRALAIKTCGLNFNHYIKTEKERGHKLVTGGVYSWCRHPSYLGFIFYVGGMQIILGNPITAILCGIVLYRFFGQRIRFEEYFLTNTLFGEEYRKYMMNTASLIPFLW